MQPILLLIADTDRLIAEILGDALADDGYEIVHAHEGDEAIESIRDQRDEPRSVITAIDFDDGASGSDVATAARGRQRGVAILFTARDEGGDWPVERVPNDMVVARPYVVGQGAAIAALLSQADPAGLANGA